MIGKLEDFLLADRVQSSSLLAGLITPQFLRSEEAHI